jgi:tetratricopeptide (TPR) repeat protein
MTERVRELMSRAYELPYGEARTLLTEEALRHAEASGDEALAFQVRLGLTTAYQYGGETAKTFTTFSRCLADLDRMGEAAGDGAAHRVLWHFKWIVNSLTRFPEVPLDRTYAVLDDMERRYRDGGHSLHAVHGCREKVARHLGDKEAAATWYARWHAAARDELADCEACDPTAKVAHLAWQGRDEEAVAVAAPVLDRQVTCSSQPQAILSELLPIYLRTGRHEEARDAHRRAYRLIRTELADMEDLDAHIEFCARTGNEPRGLEIVERHLDWLDRAPNPYAAMRFAAAAALLLRRLDEMGPHDATVAGRPAADVRAELTARATELAGRFDARNGTTNQGDLVRATLTAEPLVEHLPLTPHARRPATRPAAPPPPPPVETGDPEALLDEGEERWRRGDHRAALAAWARFDESAVTPTPLQAARRADGAGLELLLSGDLDGAVASWRDTADAYAALGEEERRQAVLGRVGALLVHERDDRSAVAMVESAAGYLERHATDPARRTAALLRLAGVRTATGRPEDALALLDRCDPGPGTETERVRAYLELRDRERAVAAARRACDGYRAEGRRAELADASLRLGRLLAEDPDDDTVGAVYTEAITACPPEQEGLRLVVHAHRGGWLLARDRPAEAVEDLVEAVAGFTAMGARPQAAYAGQDLCAAYYNTGRHLEAAEAAEEAIAVFERIGDADAANSCRFVLAHAQRQIGEPESAADAFTALADVQAGTSPGHAAELLATAGELLSGVDKDLLAAERYAAAAALHREAGDPLPAVAAARRHGMCLFWAGRPDDALAAMADVHAELDALADPDLERQVAFERAALGYEEARVLAATGRFDEAAKRAEEARERFGALDAADAVTTVERLLADIREAAGE